MTIKADPQQYPTDGSLTDVTMGSGEPSSVISLPDIFGALPDLSQETSDSSIPRVSATTLTPFVAYTHPAEDAMVRNWLMIAIIVTGLGLNEQDSLNAVDKLPSAMTLAFSPYGKALSATVDAARTAVHEVMLKYRLSRLTIPRTTPDHC